MNSARERDMLDELTEVQAQSDPRAADEWEAMKIVARLLKIRKEKGLTQAEVASRMGLPQQRVAEIERRPWGVGFGRIVGYARSIGVEVGILEDQSQAA